jgi:hypothetical protein
MRFDWAIMASAAVELELELASGLAAVEQPTATAATSWDQ